MIYSKGIMIKLVDDFINIYFETMNQVAQANIDN